MFIQANVQNSETVQRPVNTRRVELLHEFVADHADSGYRTALETENGSVSFRDLDIRASRVANFLISQGVQSGNVVAIRQPWTTDLFASVLGVLKAGASYIVIDPATDEGEALGMVIQSGAVVLFESSTLTPLPARQNSPTIVIENARETLELFLGKVSFAGRRRPIASRTARIVCNKGRPGVSSVKHQEAVKLTRSLIKLYGIDEGARCAHAPSVAVDVAIEEALAVLAAGATLVLGRPEAETADAWATFVAAEGITHLSTTPDQVAGFGDDVSGLQVLIVGRDQCPSDLVVKWALRLCRIVTIRRAGDRFPSYRMEQDGPAASRPNLIFARAAEQR